MAPLEPSDILITPNNIDIQKAADGQVLIRNGSFLVDLEAPVEMVEVLRFFRAPRRASEVMSEYDGIDMEVLQHLVDHFILYRPSEAEIFAFGALIRPAQPIGGFLSIKDLPPPAEARATRFLIFGAPVDLGAAGYGGARHGPEAIRAACTMRLGALGRKATEGGTAAWDFETHQRHDLTQLEVSDLGDVSYTPGESNGDFGRRVTWFAERAHAHGYLPIGLGGDHSVARFFLRPFLKTGGAPFGIVHFDAHTDLYQAPAGIFSHGNPFDEALESENLKSLFQVGQRQLRTDRAEPTSDSRLQFVSSLDVWRKSPAEVFANLPPELPCYLTFDVDCMSATECPETGTPVPGGLLYYHALELVDWLVANRRIVGADFVEVTGPVSPSNRAAQVCASLMLRLIVGHGPTTRFENPQLHRKGTSLDTFGT